MGGNKLVREAAESSLNPAGIVAAHSARLINVGL